MSSALITGGAGFIGSHVADAFLADGLNVTILDDFSAGKRDNVPAAARVIEESVSSPAAARLLRSESFDLVVHCAAHMAVQASFADPLGDATTNVLGTVNVLEAIRERRDRPRVVFASTGSVLYGGNARPPYAETTAKHPDSPYATAKLAAEQYASYFARLHALDIVSLRLGNVYGPRQDPNGEGGVVAIFCGRILAGRALTVFGDGTQTRDFVYVEDVVRAIQAAAKVELGPPARFDDRAFNIGTGVPTSVNEIARRLVRLARSDVGVEYAPLPPGDERESYLSVEKAARELKWRPQVSLDEGLARTFEWFAAHTPGDRAQHQSVRKS